MDDFTLSNLYESKNEWSARLVSILTPLVKDGFNSIYNEAFKLCKDNKEDDKYLMTLQNLISRIPKWNNSMLEAEFNRIVEQSNCTYLNDLLSCVHVIQLKILTCVRAGKEQKKIDIDIPKFTTFLHNVYINAARKIYSNIYLYENNVPPLQKQKHNRELEMFIQEAIINTIRDNMPIEELLKAYIDEHVEEDIEEEISEKTYNVEEEKKEDDSWKEIPTETLLKDNESEIVSEVKNDDTLVVSNDISNELKPSNDGDGINKAITFNEEVIDNDLGITDLNDDIIKISDDDVMLDIESLDKNDDDEIKLNIEELE
jgi:hypothetical protein|tara:strand:+ start:12 stop:956 length:945 start_codon:yes stop_codon:yes gene_type:complete